MEAPTVFCDSSNDAENIGAVIPKANDAVSQKRPRPFSNLVNIEGRLRVNKKRSTESPPPQVIFEDDEEDTEDKAQEDVPEIRLVLRAVCL